MKYQNNVICINGLYLFPRENTSCKNYIVTIILQYHLQTIGFLQWFKLLIR